jgi:ComF family protein
MAHHGFKFEGMERLACDLAKKMMDCTIPGFWEGVEAIVPVPLSAERQRERGYNPAELLACEISKASQIPLKNILGKVFSTQPQMSLKREERLKNPQGAYKVLEKTVVPSKLVLVDDVFTTGATLEECARVLKNSGISWVGAIVFGRTPRHQII